MGTKEVTRLGLKEGQRFDVGPYRFEVASGAFVLEIRHDSGRKVFAENLGAGWFDIAVTSLTSGPELLD